MITIKLEELLNASLALQELANTSLPASTAFLVARIVRAHDTEVESFNKIRDAMVKRYATEEVDGGMKIPDDKAAEFQAEYADLLGTEVTLDAAHVSPDKLGDAKMKPLAMLALEKFIEPDS